MKEDRRGRRRENKRERGKSEVDSVRRDTSAIERRLHISRIQRELRLVSRTDERAINQAGAPYEARCGSTRDRRAIRRAGSVQEESAVRSLGK